MKKFEAAVHIEKPLELWFIDPLWNFDDWEAPGYKYAGPNPIQYLVKFTALVVGPDFVLAKDDCGRLKMFNGAQVSNFMLSEKPGDTDKIKYRELPGLPAHCR